MAAEARRARGGRRDSDGTESESEAEEDVEGLDHDERRTAKAAAAADEPAKPKRVLKPRAKLDADRCTGHGGCCFPWLLTRTLSSCLV